MNKIRLTIKEDDALVIRFMLDFCLDKVGMTNDEKVLLRNTIKAIEDKIGYIAR